MPEEVVNHDLNTTEQPSSPVQEPESCRGRRRLSAVTIELPDIAPPQYSAATALSKPPVYSQAVTAPASARVQPPRMFEGEFQANAPSGGFYEQYVDTPQVAASSERRPWYRYKLTIWACFFFIVILISVIVHFLHPGVL
ncbi:hypothetical protein NQZ79_g2977 [Umbelopsis isabellina]|nr:hypothetical protein NQZ79_g2977 [Umbelopsis isabellina]